MQGRRPFSHCEAKEEIFKQQQLLQKYIERVNVEFDEFINQVFKMTQKCKNQLIAEACVANTAEIQTLFEKFTSVNTGNEIIKAMDHTYSDLQKICEKLLNWDSDENFNNPSISNENNTQNILNCERRLIQQNVLPTNHMESNEASNITQIPANTVNTNDANMTGFCGFFFSF